MKRVLVIDDDPGILDNVLELLEAEGFDGVGAHDGKSGVAKALSRPPDLIVCDIGMPVMDGYAVLASIRDYPHTATVPFIFLTARASRADVRQGMNLGADDYLTKPFARRELLDAVRSRLDRHAALTSEPDAPPGPRGAPSSSGPIVESSALRAVYAEAVAAARSDLAVLLLGETGVGKDVLAHAVHQASRRAAEPFVPLNCAALSDSLLESELFGHEKGAFTGATARREGLFEAADGGTVFLDEIGDLPSATQVTLLRVLEDRRVRRVGGRSYVDIDVRFVSATNKDLQAESAAGRFRMDLFYRIGAVVLTVPPLRDRRADIAPLVQRFGDGMRKRMGWAGPAVVEPGALDAMVASPWPGNVRELRNVVERAVALSGGDAVALDHLPAPLRSGGGGPAGGPSEAPRSGGLIEDARAHQRELEKRRIQEALDAHGGNQTRTARALGISRRTLINRLDEFGLPRPRK
jgi:DNA-binding NtrC family response regulator